LYVVILGYPLPLKKENVKLSEGNEDSMSSLAG
jgi:hypothetical protein